MELPEDMHWDEHPAEPGMSLSTTAKGGRPRKAEKYSEIYQANEAQLHRVLTLIPTALAELVAGVWREEWEGRGENRTRRVYQQPPSIEAIKVVLDRTLGKETQKLEVDALVRTVSLDTEEYTQTEKVEILELVMATLKGDVGGPDDGAGTIIVDEGPLPPVDEASEPAAPAVSTL